MAVVSFQPKISREQLFGSNPLTTSKDNTGSIFTALQNNPFANQSKPDALMNQKSGGFVYNG